MVLRLIDPGRDPVWRDLPRGVRVKVRPMTSVHETAARHAATRKLTAMIDGADVMAELGLPGDPEAVARDPGMMLGLSELLAAIELGTLLIVAWDGPADPDTGAPVPPERPWIARLFLLFPDVRAAFWKAAAAHLDAVSAEGNGSAPSPTGSPAGAPPTAGAARRRVSPVRPAAAAPTDGAAPSGSTPR